MISSIEDLRSAGMLPTGPVSAWPQERNKPSESMQQASVTQHDTKVSVTPAQMAKGFLRTATQAIANGKVDTALREQRYNICKECPHFIEESKRCSECGCFMEAKTWVAGDPKMLCPKNKWPK